jgi:hypothetical protein
VKIPDASVVEGETVHFSAVATDTDVPAQTLTFSLDPGAPNGASIDPLTGLFSWTTAEADGPGVYTVRVRVTDSASPAGTSMQEVAITVAETNQAPVLVALTDHTIAEWTTLQFTAEATDADLPNQSLTYSLASGALAGAAIDAATGVFTWTPTELQGGTTNRFTIVVADDGVPGSNAVQSFTVIVRDTEPDFLVSAGSTNVFAGQTSAIPLTLLSELELATVSFTLETDITRLTNLVLHAVSPEVETVEFREMASNQFAVSLVLDPARRVAANRVLANLAFQAVPATNSAVVAVRLSEPLAILGESALRDGGVTGGQVMIVNQQPVLTIQRASVPRLTLYGNPGTSYRVESTADLASGIWTTVTEVQLTSPSTSLDVDLGQPCMFYRVREL